MLSRHYKAAFSEFIRPFSLKLHRLHLSPDHLTAAGLVLALFAGAAYARGAFIIGGLLLSLSGVSDALDGSLARNGSGATTFGAFLDSVTDRYAELFVFGGLAWHFADGPFLFLVLACLAGSFMVSYTRARAEGLGHTCEVGIMERPERIVLLAAGSLFGFLVPALWVLAVMANVTALHRIHHTWKKTRPDDDRLQAHRESPNEKKLPAA